MEQFKYLFFVVGILFFFSCNSENGNGEKSVEEIRAEDVIRNSDIIRNPATANAPADTVNVAKITFDNSTYEFEEVVSGAVVEHVFAFTNTGKVPLIITHARSTCGCTVPEWPRKPIQPGDKGTISVKFDTKNRKNKQHKPVHITANTYPAITTVHMRGFVREKK